MKVIVELYGATKDMSNNNFLEFEIEKNSSIKDLKIKILNFIENKFKGNQNLKNAVKNSAFCSDDDNIVSENYIISKNQTIGIIPPIGGG
ncbi:molybdopterin biosynthesis protein MoeD [bacterium]|nr:molybdopterin biosynthesis protein MoeD [bacterium]